MYRAKQLWECGENIYLAGLNEDGTHHQTKYLRREEYLPVGSIVHMEGREFRVDKVDFDKDSVTLQDMALADLRMPIFREVPLAIVRELYEQEPEPPVLVSDGLGLPGEDSNKLPVSIEVNEVPTPPEAAAAEEGLNEEGAPEPAGNFRITDEELGAGGPKQKFARNIKAIKTLFTLEQEHRGATAEEQQVLSQYHTMGNSIKAAEARLTEIAVLKTHIINYAKTRPVYDAYRKSGYSKKFLEAHREEITLHKAAKAAFDEAGLQKLPKVKELDAEFAELLTKKKAAYPDYRKARDEMQELVRAQKNVERFFAEEKDTTEKTQTR